jgi:hypothetical protein
MSFPPLGLGGVLAIIAVVLIVVFLAIGKLPLVIGGLLLLLALSRLT